MLISVACEAEIFALWDCGPRLDQSHWDVGKYCWSCRVCQRLACDHCTREMSSAGEVDMPRDMHRMRWRPARLGPAGGRLRTEEMLQQVLRPCKADDWSLRVWQSACKDGMKFKSEGSEVVGCD